MSEKMKAFINLMHGAFNDAQDANRQIANHEELGTSKELALSYVGTAMSQCYAAQAMFYSNIDELEHMEIRGIFHQFDVFKNEVQDNFVTGHSHQWSNIEFERLKELYEDSIFNQRLSE